MDELGLGGSSIVGSQSSIATLSRQLTRMDGLGITVGVIIGSGIFSSPGVMLDQVHSVGLWFLCWILSCCVALLSSLVYAELGPAFPCAGGDRDYIEAAFGRRVSFAYTWTMFFVIKSGAQGILGVTFARYLVSGLHKHAVPASDVSVLVKMVAIGTVSALTATNCAFLRMGSTLQNVLTVLKMVLLLLLVCGAVKHNLEPSDPESVADSDFAPSLPSNATAPAEFAVGSMFDGSNWIGLAPATVAALWAFDGWNDIVFMAEELKEPGKDLPMIILSGLGIVLAVYLSINVCYLALLDTETIKNSKVILMDAVNVAFGPRAAQFASILVALSVLGSLNASTMTGGRLFYAAARAGHMPRFMAEINPTTRTPINALLVQNVIAVCILSAPGATFENLVTYFGSSSWIWYGITAMSLIQLRRTDPYRYRPFKAPVAVAALVALVAAYLVVSEAVTNLMYTMASIGFIVISFPVFELFNRLGWMKPVDMNPYPSAVFDIDSP
eukprot:CAMPEP_0114280042 /NCGR_PEP_ID=MMETSP0059-20121206/2224_1 /TAXON_ID=36894 /ORGANISM="Pyramimonas parkeae, Strain CCMP726" /LENGTH=498 /DNA_ID=CAMNT_0001400411 /DNA_START=121 /DNA_END=1613 /DNA_ORIENTATION=-